ncbi:LysR substrate-binding domain-containing protein [Solihabitans fulvus]|uniref:LysR substrate-binding domain-containing protein n=1 Tax=Solihabitans fulvus TaxID=1892852 RepID=UPI001661A9E8|nr:LysR substrate-binding domain-containing protein [Solihabitans fulvus]
MELRVLRYVVAVADEGGFRRAAARLHLAQPSLSRQIRDLERGVGVQLFERRPTRLTAPGEVFVESARRLLAEADDLVLRTRVAAGSKPVRLGYVASAAYETVPRLLAAVGERHRDVRVDVREAWTPDLELALRDRRLDLAVSHSMTGAAGLSRALLRSEPLVAVVAAGHRLADHPEVSLRDLRGETFCFFGRQLAPRYHDVVMRALAGAGERFAVWEHPQPGLRQTPLRGEDGFTVVPRSVGPHLPAGLVALPLLGDLPQVDLDIVWRSDGLCPSTAAVLESALAAAREDDWNLVAL